ncbi:unnamed protein product [Adineta steineri]|uniref:Uncharacterized protein n=1 Tax=Adineta steineri TaxID=433720 RepID=A0A818KDR8_9BILA|nr:unnamed protein product [Adineta steineri]CAF1496423.1 unnamed protein product [Adineta steineri]CAF3558435.1 unnamed protein product [Adineta steineri]CAF3827148.1 unnamed protein product [Adineta steineri]
MGFDTGITVYQRVTDENKWNQFLRALYNKYHDSPQVKLRVNYDIERDKFKALHEPIGDIRAIRLCEQFNFPSESSCYWKTGVAAEIHKTSSGWSFGGDDWDIARQKTIPLLRDAAEKLHYTISDEQLIEWGKKGIDPPIAMVFETGEHPFISLYGHHFRGCNTRMSFHDSTPTETIVRDIYKLFNRFFPDHAFLWNELEDDYTGASDRYYVPGSRYQTCITKETDDELNQFYDQLIQEYQT